jgi:hypothetical protein
VGQLANFFPEKLENSANKTGGKSNTEFTRQIGGKSLLGTYTWQKNKGRQTTMIQPIIIPIVLFVGFFTFLIVTVICKMISTIFQNRASIRFMQSLVDRGYSAAEIERIVRAARLHESNPGTDADCCGAESSSTVTRPVPPVKQTAYH